MRGPRPRLWLACTVAALAVVVLSGDLPASPWSDVTAAAGWASGLLLIGYIFQRQALLPFTVVLVVIALIADATWSPSAREDPGASLVVLALPLLLALICSGALVGRWRTRNRVQ